jgi:hypothetical protein
MVDIAKEPPRQLAPSMGSAPTDFCHPCEIANHHQTTFETQPGQLRQKSVLHHQLVVLRGQEIS